MKVPLMLKKKQQNCKLFNKNGEKGNKIRWT